MNDNEHGKTDKAVKSMKRPGSMFCRKLPVGNTKEAKSFRNQEYITESLLIVLIMIIALRVIEHYTTLMNGLYGSTYIIVNIIVDIVLLVITFTVIRILYEGRVRRFNEYLEAEPELRESIEREDAEEILVDNSGKSGYRSEAGDDEAGDNEAGVNEAETNEDGSDVESVIHPDTGRYGNAGADESPEEYMSFEEFSRK